MPRLQRARRCGQHGAELEHAGQVQRDQREQRGQRRHDHGRLQLEAPAELLAGRAQRQHHAAQREERQRPRRPCRRAPPMRWPRRSSACRVKPTTLIASTGNTQGIRFRIRPPSSAPSERRPAGRCDAARRRCGVRAQCVLPAPATRRPRGGRGRPVRRRTLRFGAPALAAGRRPPRASRRGLRCAARTAARCAVHTSPFQACVHARRRCSITSRGFGEELQRLAAHATPAGPCTLTCSVAIGARLSRGAPASGFGLRRRSAASNAAACSAVVLRARQLQHEVAVLGDAFLACTPARWPSASTVESRASGEGLKSGVIVSGTGSSTVPS